MHAYNILPRSFTAAAAAVAIFIGFGVGVAHEWMAPADEGKRVNPITADQTSIAQGKIIYLDNCAACHGGNIEGMKAEETGLSTDSPDLKRRLLTHTDGDFFWKIRNGRGDMPSFQEELSDKEIWDVINYIRSESD
jgi:mono/diheme cytochrome c family protein